MKTYICDICARVMGNPNIWRGGYMQEISTRRNWRGEKKKIHLCEDCLRHIAQLSREGSDVNECQR